MGYLQDAFAALVATGKDALLALAGLAAPVPTPVVADDDFGADLDCADDFTPLFDELDTKDPKLVAQAVYRRLTTPRGGLIDDPDYGFDVRTLLHKPLSATYQAAIPGLIRAEVMKDDRVATCTVTLSNVTPLGFDVAVACTTARGPFSLTFSVADAAVRLKEIS